MAVRKKKRATDNEDGTLLLKQSIKEKALVGIDELLEQHLKAALELVEESESGKVNIALGLEIDCSDSDPKLKLKMRFTKSETDSRVYQIDNPDQLNLWANRPEEQQQEPEPEGKGVGAEFVERSEQGQDGGQATDGGEAQAEAQPDGGEAQQEGDQSGEAGGPKKKRASKPKAKKKKK